MMSVEISNDEEDFYVPPIREKKKEYVIAIHELKIQDVFPNVHLSVLDVATMYDKMEIVRYDSFKRAYEVIVSMTIVNRCTEEQKTYLQEVFIPSSNVKCVVPV